MRAIKTISSFTSDSLDERVNETTRYLISAGYQVIGISVAGEWCKTATIIYETGVSADQMKPTTLRQHCERALGLIVSLLALVLLYQALPAALLAQSQLYPFVLTAAALVCAVIFVQSLRVIFPRWGIMLGLLVLAAYVHIFEQDMYGIQEHPIMLTVVTTGLVITLLLFQIIFRRFRKIYWR
ncbi:hypothetical protein [Lacticaseibacillus paracasei]|uniref:hypothetical protein n=1 Tax=Lacticaseibacillus paracasei TaxID=1597 RepID=UPI0021C2741C|nr:hypothetical protein [Lacticaseibacillus paracasei]MCP9305311.1 hypothetical protein [Lacticaseibacillus paracasei]MCP9310987.1 hypothetical protein [Lacticaseibacillus paracasei]MCP9347608.1 hypothetical protein [Lacticaseibacillus paracasei]MCP9367232.1 hypothetical protein [Lacticaseibacillus paracasei]MCP9379785.1 hypothetical protein [Lacticaseibacillus paracasei]